MPFIRASFLALLWCCLLAMPAQAFSSSSDVPDELLEQLSKGINIERILQHPDDRMPAAGEFDQLRRLGFRHLRIPLNPRLLMVNQAQHLAKLDLILEQARAADLHVTVDLHPDYMWHGQMKTNFNAASIMLRHSWRILATHLAETTTPADVSLELINEPTLPAWYLARILPSLLETVRSIAPKHTIIIGPAYGYHIDGLRELPHFKDKNIVYAIHFYDPMIFSHQGAFWSSRRWLGFAKNIPFPAKKTSATEAIILDPSVPSDVKEKVALYVQSNFNSDNIKKYLQKASNWAKKRGNVPLIINEFGVLKDDAPANDRALWIKIVRQEAENLGIGWTFWDYSTGFGLMNPNPEGNGYLVDPMIAKALNLRIQPPIEDR